MCAAADVGRLFKHGEVVLQVFLLVLDAEVEGAGSECVQPSVRTGTVLAHNHRVSGVVAVLFGEELLEACDVASVPALVEVPAYDVGNLAQSGFVVAVAAVEGHGADACGVFLLQGILQPAGKGEGTFQYRFQCVAFVLALCYEEDFVHISPRDDAGVVVVLANHLAQVTFAVFRILRCVGHDVYDGNFFPGQHSQLVTHLYDSVVLWIMGNSDEVGSHLFH